MVQPLSPRSNGALNAITPIRIHDSKLENSRPTPPLRNELDDTASLAITSNSSPFETDIATDLGQENRPPPREDFTPLRARPSKPRGTPNGQFQVYDDESGVEPSLPPLRISPRIIQRHSRPSSALSPCKVPLPSSSPEKSSPSDERAVFPSPGKEKTALDVNFDLSEVGTRSVASDNTRFSAFSAVPNADMTLFSRLGNRQGPSPFRSPFKRNENVEGQTPSAPVFTTPATSRRHRLDDSARQPSPTPRGNRCGDLEGDTTNLLLDFTQHLDGAERGRQSPIKSTTEPNLLAHINNQRIPSPTKSASRTPGVKRNLLNLLDFDLPPQPTPRSVPSITVRELESLKSSYSSELSSLKASLSGREAEVGSLKKAVTDAERRVGEALETVREERSAREHAENGKAEWEKKGKEVEELFKSVKEEYLAGEKEKDELTQKLEESNKAREDAELSAAEAATKASIALTDFDGKSSNSSATDAVIATKVAQQLDERMENLARELHSVYKKKHETKVATLKKTYEVRGDKKCKELQKTVEELTRQIDNLQATKESSLSLELPGNRRTPSEGSNEQKVEVEEQRARIAGLMEEMSSVKETQASLLKDLEAERVEKGELVAAVDEMLALQTEIGAPDAMEDFRKSINRPSGVKALGFAESRVGRIPAPPARSVSGGKSKMMSNIERMGGRRMGG